MAGEAGWQRREDRRTQRLSRPRSEVRERRRRPAPNTRPQAPAAPEKATRSDPRRLRRAPGPVHSQGRAPLCGGVPGSSDRHPPPPGPLRPARARAPDRAAGIRLPAPTRTVQASMRNASTVTPNSLPASRCPAVSPSQADRLLEASTGVQLRFHRPFRSTPQSHILSTQRRRRTSQDSQPHLRHFADPIQQTRPLSHTPRQD